MSWVVGKTGDPSQVFCRFFANGQDILDTSTGNWRFINFTHSRASHTASGSTFTLTLFDKQWEDVEALLFSKALDNNYFFFDYGYTTGDRSPVYYGLFSSLSVRPVFSSGGVTITIEGTGNGFYQNTVNVNNAFKNQRISQIVESLALENGMQIGYIEPTRRISGIGDPTNSNRYFEAHNQSFYQFVIQTLTPYAISEKDGQGGYRLRIDNSKTPPAVYYQPTDFSQKNVVDNTIRKYTVFRDRMGEVLQWEPQFDLYQLYASMGGVIKTSTIDPIQKKVVSSTYDPRTNEQPSAQGDNKTFYQQFQDASTIGRTLSLPGQSQQDVLKRQIAVSQASRLEVFNASLSVIGDPLIVAEQFIFITMLTNLNVPHYSSGVYRINSVTDEVGTQGYETQMTLLRPNARDASHLNDGTAS